MIKLDSLRVDLKAQSEGQWQPAPWPKVRLRVRSIEYGPYKEERDRERERLAQQYVNANAPDNVWTPILGRLLADHILLEWDGLDPAYDPVIAAAARVGIRELEFTVVLEKNSAQPSVIN